MTNNESENKNKKSNSTKIFGYIIVLLVLIGTIIYFVYSSQNDTNSENESLKRIVNELQKDNDKKEDLINRLDAKNVNKEEEEIRKKAKEFVKVLYVTDPQMDDKKRYENAKKVMDKSLADQYYGDKRKSPIKYKTEIENVNIYSERYSPKKSDYHMYLTLTQAIKDNNGKIVSSRDVASEMTLKQEKSNDWKVVKFKQFDDQRNEYKDEDKD
ncbi:hypothetical protein QI094_12575 [Staphylococcus saprophyticus]|nr:hypothetical protein [Staphylococcus saprophyticus]